MSDVLFWLAVASTSRGAAWAFKAETDTHQWIQTCPEVCTGVSLQDMYWLGLVEIMEQVLGRLPPDLIVSVQCTCRTLEAEIDALREVVRRGQAAIRHPLTVQQALLLTNLLRQERFVVVALEANNHLDYLQLLAGAFISKDNVSTNHFQRELMAVNLLYTLKHETTRREVMHSDFEETRSDRPSICQRLRWLFPDFCPTCCQYPASCRLFVDGIKARWAQIDMNMVQQKVMQNRWALFASIGLVSGIITLLQTKDPTRFLRSITDVARHAV